MNICNPQVITSADGTPYFERAPYTISGISCTPADGSSQLSVSVGGAAAVVFPPGASYFNDSRDGSMFCQSLRVNVVAGTVIFTANN